MSLFSCLSGDCIERMAEIASASIDMVLVDLPYGTTKNHWDSIIPFEKLWGAWRRLCKPGAPVVLFTQQPFTTAAAASNLKNLRTEWIWEKANATGFLNARRYPLKAHENILVFCDRMPPYFPQMGEGKRYRTKRNGFSNNYGKYIKHESANTGARFPRSVVKLPHDRNVAVGHKGLHPTQKPVAMCEYLIRTYTAPGATVLDCCMGSGTTGVAAINTGRRFIGIEREPKYFELAAERIGAAVAAELAAFWS